MGAEGLRGAAAAAETALEPRGAVIVSGELWRAESLDGPHPAGTALFVESVEGLTLKVRKR